MWEDAGRLVCNLVVLGGNIIYIIISNLYQLGLISVFLPCKIRCCLGPTQVSPKDYQHLAPADRLQHVPEEPAGKGSSTTRFYDTHTRTHTNYAIHKLCYIYIYVDIDYAIQSNVA